MNILPHSCTCCYDSQLGGGYFTILIFPPLIEIITFWEKVFGKYSWILWKDIFVMIFGLLFFGFGSYVSIWNIIQPETIQA
jgi:hypothetical protein